MKTGYMVWHKRTEYKLPRCLGWETRMWTGYVDIGIWRGQDWWCKLYNEGAKIYRPVMGKSGKCKHVTAYVTGPLFVKLLKLYKLENTTRADYTDKVKKIVFKEGVKLA